MNNQQVVQQIADLVKDKFATENSGHDWEHTEKVWKNAKEIAEYETNVNMLVVELAALLHDVNDWKRSEEEVVEGNENIKLWLKNAGVEGNLVEEILEVIKNISFYGPNSVVKEISSEARVVMDADRLEAMGKVGWERTLQFGRAKNRPEINDCLPNLNLTEAEYKDLSRKGNTAINHVFEKLLLLKNRLMTVRGKELGKDRHEELKMIIKEYLQNLMETNIVPNERIKEYIEMLDEPLFN